MKTATISRFAVLATKKTAFAILCGTLLMLVTAPTSAQVPPDQCAGALPIHVAPTDTVPDHDVTGCGALITVTGVDSGTGAATFFTVKNLGNGNPYDGADDTLVGIVNNSGHPLNSITLTAPVTGAEALFNFEDDGPCHYNGQSPCNPSPADYQGPQNTFTDINNGKTSGTVLFSPAIPSSCEGQFCNSTWFALEGTPDSLTTVTQTQPTPPGVTTPFDFGPFNFKSTPAPTTQNGNQLAITAVPIPAGTQIHFADNTVGTCITYDHTDGNCRAFDIQCSGTSDCGGTYFAEFSTAYDVDHNILAPGLAKGEPDCGDISHTTFTNQIDFFSQTSKDPTTKGRSGGTASCWIAVENVNYPNADLSVTKVGPLLVKRGAPLPYGIAVLNLGPGTATAVTVTDPIPAGTTFLNSAVCFTGKSGVTCQSGAQSPCVSDGARVTCTLGNLLPFSLKTLAAIGIQLNFRAPAASGTVSNTAAVSALNPDLKTGNNTSTWKTTVK